MQSQLRNLRRMMALECAEIALRDLCHEFYDEWQAAAARAQTLPEPSDFLHRVRKLGFYLPTSARALNHLTQCRRENQPPDPDTLLGILLPWTLRL